MRTTSSVKILSFISFLFSLQAAGTLYVDTVFLSKTFSPSIISLIFGISAIITLVGINSIPMIVTRIGSHRVFMVLGLLSIISLWIMGYINHPILIAISFSLYFIINILTYLVYDIVLDHFSPDTKTGRLRGIYLTCVNAGYVLAPIGMGYILGRFNFSALYTIALCLIILVMTCVWLLPNITPVHTRMSFWKTAKLFFKEKGLRGIFWINFILQFFYAWMVLYAQQYFHTTLGLPWGVVGTLLSLSLIAFIVLQIPVGWVLDKFHNERLFLFIGLIIMGISTLFFTRILVNQIALLATVFFITRIGASIIEVTSESYFFKEIDQDNTAAIGFFRNTYPLAYIIAPILATGIFWLHGDYHTIFMTLGIIVTLSSITVIGLPRNR